jgi:hypothetical protein
MNTSGRLKGLLPGDKSVQAIREEHLQHQNMLADGRGEFVNLHLYARVERLLAELDSIDDGRGWTW